MSLVRFVIFTFGRDADATAEVVKYLTGPLEQREVVVIDDAKNPFNAAEVEAVKAAGADYRVSSWARGGNLNGKTAVMNVLTDLVGHSGGVQWVCKLDADTLPTRAFLAALARYDGEYDMLASGNGKPEHPIFGACYALSPAAVARLQMAASYLDPAMRNPEDDAVGKLAMAYGLKVKTHLLAWPDYHRPGMFIKWNPAWAICFGFITDTVGKPARTKAIYGKFVADKLRTFIQFDTSEKKSGELHHTDASPPLDFSPCPETSLSTPPPPPQSSVLPPASM